MKISESNKKKLIEEIKFVIEKMKSEEDAKTKLYYFSAIYGTMQRIFNIEYNSDLVFAHMVTSATYNTLNSRLSIPDRVVQLPPEIFDKLTAVTEELKNTLEKNGNLYNVLKKYAILGLVTSGNGYYLYQRGIVKI